MLTIDVLLVYSCFISVFCYVLPDFRACSGYICIALPGEALDKLELPLMVANNTEHYKTAYTVTADYAQGT